MTLCARVQGLSKAAYLGLAGSAPEASTAKAGSPSRSLAQGKQGMGNAVSLPERLSSGMLRSESCDASGKRTVEVETDQKFIDDGYRLGQSFMLLELTWVLVLKLCVVSGGASTARSW